jgi:glycosyltransferase involved in cell wall biosynthesis
MTPIGRAARGVPGEYLEQRMRDAAPAAVVSVVMPAFNQATYVGDALDSLGAQTYARWECIVVDDGSNDNTQDVVEERARLDPRIRYMRQGNAGPSSARNSGLLLTSGDLVQLLDADDVLGPRKLEQHVRTLAENPAADLVYGRSRKFRRLISARPPESEDWLPDPGCPTPSGSGLNVLTPLLVDNIMVIEAPLLRRALIHRAGDFDPSLRAMEDWEFWLRCALEGAVFLFDPSEAPATFAYVRVHTTNASRNTVAMLRAELAVRRVVAAGLQSADLRRLNQRRSNEGLARIGRIEGARGNVAVGMRSLIRAGRAERRVRWLLMGSALPALRLPLVQRTIKAVRARALRSSRPG